MTSSPTDGWATRHIPVQPSNLQPESRWFWCLSVMLVKLELTCECGLTKPKKETYPLLVGSRRTCRGFERTRLSRVATWSRSVGENENPQRLYAQNILESSGRDSFAGPDRTWLHQRGRARTRTAW